MRSDREAMHCSSEEALNKAFKERDEAVEKYLYYKRLVQCFCTDGINESHFQEEFG